MVEITAKFWLRANEKQSKQRWWLLQEKNITQTKPDNILVNSENNFERFNYSKFSNITFIISYFIRI
jgi:hypothetical protein